MKEFFDSIPAEILDFTKNMDLNIKSKNAHIAIQEILDATVLKGGKRLRPLLTFLMGNLFDLSLETLTPFARATELVHAASLSHDDVIDNATLRRGEPSINIVSSNKKAVLAGDYLLSQVIVDLCESENLILVKEMSKVIKELSEGEWLQLDLIESRNYSKALIREIAAKKTSSVMSYCTFAPAILANSPEEIVGYAKKLGFHLGMAFQLIDDTLDYSDNLQKDQLLDLKNGIVNSVTFEFLNLNENLFLKFKDGEDLTEILNNQNLIPFVQKIKEEAHHHLEEAQNALFKVQSHLLAKVTCEIKKQKIEKATQNIELIIAFIGMREF